VLDAFLEALTGRRLGGALFVFAGLVLAAVVVWPSGDGDRTQTTKVQPARIVSVPQLGLSFAYPSTWERSVSGEVIRLFAPDGSVLTFATPVGGRYDKRVKAESEQALRTRFAPASIVHEGPAKLGARPAASFELEGTGVNGAMRALVLVSSSEFRTYVATLITSQTPSAKTLAQVQQVLATVRLTQPELPSKR
jgi:hypothetical protein